MIFHIGLWNRFFTALTWLFHPSIHILILVTKFEVKDPESGASELYHPQVLLSDGKATWLEPLSRHWFDPAPYPGKVQWLPATAGPGVVSGREVLMM